MTSLVAGEICERVKVQVIDCGSHVKACCDQSRWKDIVTVSEDEEEDSIV